MSGLGQKKIVEWCKDAELKRAGRLGYDRGPEWAIQEESLRRHSRGLKVFLSSVMQGYEDERDTAARGIMAAGVQVVRWEAGRAEAEGIAGSPLPPEQAYLDGVRKADACVVLLGRNYGSIGSEGVSATEAEYLEAVRLRREVLPLLDARSKDSMVVEQKAFLEKIGASNSWAEFSDGNELEKEAQDVVRRFVHRTTAKRVRFDEMVLSVSEWKRAAKAEGQFLEIVMDSNDDVVRSWLGRIETLVAKGEATTFVADGVCDHVTPIECYLDRGTVSHFRARIVARVEPRTPTLRLSELGSDLAISDDGDLFLRSGDLALVSGLDNLVQRLRWLFAQRGDWQLGPSCGSDLPAIHRKHWKDPVAFSLLGRFETIRALTARGGERSGLPSEFIERVESVDFSDITVNSFSLSLAFRVACRPDVITWEGRYTVAKRVGQPLGLPHQ
jgi:hypothetical protein